MLRKYLIIVAIFWLSGCPGPGDRLVERQSTTVVIKNNNVCILSLLKPDERITAVQIVSERGAPLHKIFDDAPAYVAQGECLPLFGYRFVSGGKYAVAYDVQSDGAQSRLLTADIAVAYDRAGRVRLL